MSHSSPKRGFVRCNCTKPGCSGETWSKAVSDRLGLTLNTAHILCNTLKQLGSIGHVPGLSQGAGALLIVIAGLQDMKEVRGGFTNILLDICNLMKVVARRIHEKGVKKIPREMRRAIGELTKTILDIKGYCDAMQRRNAIVQFINSSADKAKVGEWRTKYEEAREAFRVDLEIGNSLEIREIMELLRPRADEHPSGASNYEAPQEHNQAPAPQHQQSYNAQANGYVAHEQQSWDWQNQHQDTQWNQYDQQDYQWGGGQAYAEPQHYEDPYSTPQYSDYPQSNGQQYHNNGGYSQYPQRQWTSPQPQFSPPASSAGRSYTIGSVMNGNFGDNHGLIVQG
ncbi:hypothetical protein D9611_011192 [Ephemerocybe angulata]|uniref:Uncharacterized protein n=1 Tax=Ephemerocybe angulata TaxID=980116 RepID=A0A8H5CCC5_9AGAR|nr:hypothetical protein D9611_011192 [Tulosesus angulatus]